MVGPATTKDLHLDHAHVLAQKRHFETKRGIAFLAVPGAWLNGVSQENSRDELSRT